MTSPRIPLAAATGALALVACRTFESPVANFDPRAMDELLSSPVVSDLDTAPDHPWSYPDVEEPEPEAPPLTPRLADDEEVSLELRGVPLGEALHLIAERAGANVVLDAELGTPVSASFPSVKLDDALQILLAQHGLELVEEPGEIYWVRRADGSTPTLASFQLRSINAVDVVDDLTTLLGGGATVVADTNQNVVLVRGTEADSFVAEEYLARADRLKPQVLLEVRIFEASLTDDFEFGITQSFDGTPDDDTWTVLQALATPGRNFSTTFADDGGDVTATINALRDHVGLELISAPRVMAVTNTQATVEIIEEVPYIETTTSIDTGNSSSATTEVAFKEAGIKLAVTPVVQEGGVLQVDIDQELSEVVGTFLDIPIVDSRHFVTRFLVSDRQTIVLGGLMQSEAQDVDRGVPLLMDIPGLGRLFRSDDDTSMRRELLVFLTPRILDPNQAARMAKNFQGEYRSRTRAMMRELDQPVKGGDEE